VSYAFYYDVPGDERVYEQVKSEIGVEHPAGLVVQVVSKRPEGGLRHFSVWDSKDEWERFLSDRVEPSVAAVLATMGITDPPPRPHEHEIDVIDVVTARPVSVDSN
jgi:hypothetical protein